MNICKYSIKRVGMVLSLWKPISFVPNCSVCYWLDKVYLNRMLSCCSVERYDNKRWQLAFSFFDVWLFVCCYISVCDNGTFGTNCDSKCGHCSENVTCNSLNGRCYNGCALGHSGDFCNISTGKYSSENEWR